MKSLKNVREVIAENETTRMRRVDGEVRACLKNVTFKFTFASSVASAEAKTENVGPIEKISGKSSPGIPVSNSGI